MNNKSVIDMHKEISEIMRAIMRHDQLGNDTSQLASEVVSRLLGYYGLSEAPGSCLHESYVILVGRLNDDTRNELDARRQARLERDADKIEAAKRRDADKRREDAAKKTP